MSLDRRQAHRYIKDSIAIDTKLTARVYAVLANPSSRAPVLKPKHFLSLQLEELILCCFYFVFLAP